MEEKKKSGGRRKTTVIVLVAVAVVAVAAVAVVGMKSAAAKKYDDAIALAEKYFAEGKYEESEVEYLGAVDMDPKRREGRIGLAYVYAIQGKTAQAAEIYDALYEETGDEMYKTASDLVKDGKLPWEPELVPAHGAWRRIDISNVPFQSDLISSLSYMNMDFFRWNRDFTFDSSDPTGFPGLRMVILGNGYYDMPIEERDGKYLKEDEEYWDKRSEITRGREKKDPRGWAKARILDGDFVMYDIFYLETDVDYTDNAVKTAFNFTDDQIAADLKASEDAKILYKDGDYYILVDGWDDEPMTEMLELTGNVWTDGERYCVEFELGDFDYDDVDEDGGRVKIDRSQPVLKYYAVVGTKKIDGNHYWSYSYYGQKKPDYVGD